MTRLGGSKIVDGRGPLDRHARPTPDASIVLSRSVVRGVPLSTWWLVAIVVTLPLEASKLLFPIQQLEISRLLMLPAIAWLAVQVSRGARPLPRRLAIGAGGALLVLAVSFAVTRWSDGLLIVGAPLAYFAFAAFAAVTIRTERDLRLVGGAVVASGAIVAVMAVVQVLTGWYLWRQGELDVLSRANATFADPNITARMLGIVLIVLAAGVTLRASTGRRLWLLALGSVLVSAGLVMTGSRWGWAATAVVLAGWLLVERRSRRAFLAVGIIVLSFSVTAALNPAAMARAGDIVTGVVGSVGGEVDGSGGNLDPDQPTTYVPPRDVIGSQILRRLPIDGVRLYLLEAGVAMWEDQPIVGVGTGGFRPTLAGPYRDFIPSDRRSQPVLLHHTFLGQLSAENGWVGLASLALFLGAILVTVRRAMEHGSSVARAASLACGMAVGLVFLTSQAEGRFFSEPYLWLAVGVAGALAALTGDDGSRLGLGIRRHTA